MNRDLIARRLAGGKFDLILFDILLPGIDGLRLLQKLKAIPALSDIPALMISAIDDFDTIARCQKGGAGDYIIKPFHAVVLTSASRHA